MSKGKLSKDRAEYHLFSERYTYYGPFRQPTTIRVLRYNPEKTETETVETGREDFRDIVKDGYVNWIQVSGLENSEAITRLLLDLGILPIDCKAVLTPCHAAKIDDLNNRLIMILRSCSFGGNKKIRSEHIAVLTKDNFLITFKELDNPLFATIENSIGSNTMNIRSSGRVMLAAFVLNAIFSETIDAAIQVEEMLENLDDLLLNSKQTQKSIGKQIQHCRHANLILQKNNLPLHSEFRNLTGSAIVTSDPVMMQIFDELYNQLDYIVLTSQNSKELLSSMRDLYASNNELRTNAIMKRLTIVSTLFIPITFLVGLWGMNFKVMPELDWQYGYPIALIVLFLTAIGTWEYMRRNNWF